MQERLRRRQPVSSPPLEQQPLRRAAAEPAVPDAPTAGMVGIIYGPMVLDAPVANMTVSEAAQLLRSTLNLPLDAVALVDGREVDSSQRLTSGCRLEFVRSAGEKGAQLDLALTHDERIEIAGDTVYVYRDGCSVQQSKLAEVLAAAARRADSSPSCGVLPPGVRYWKERGNAVALAIELGPHTRAVRWLADDSPAPFGSKARYQRRSLAFPYIVILVALVGGGLTGYQQLFYRREPLRTDGELLLPNLLNVSPDSYNQKAWLCLANMDDISELSWTDKVDAIGEHIFCGGWNRSSDVHEGASYFSLMHQLDPRIVSAQAWEQASQDSPWFMLELGWKSSGLTLSAEMDRMLSQVSRVRPLTCAEDLQGLITKLASDTSRGRRRCSQL